MIRKMQEAQMHRRRDPAENRLRLVLEQMPAILWTTDVDLHVTSAMGSGLTRLKATAEQFSGALQAHLWRGDEDAPMLVAHRRALRGEAVDYQTTVLGRTFHAHIEALRDRASHIIGVVGVADDITERLRAESTLRDSERHFRSLVENSLDLVAIVDAEGIYRYASPSHQQASGFAPEELIGRNGFDFIHPEDLPRLRQLFADQIGNHGVSAAATYRFRHKNGSWRSVEAAVRNLVDDPAVAGVLVNARDVTERQQAQETLVAQSRILEAFFTSTVTPLVLLDREFNFVRVNAAYARACEREMSEFEGRNHFEFYPSDAKPIFEEVVRTKVPYQAAARPFVFPDHPEWGATYWDWTLTPILNDAGEVAFLVFSLKDVSDMKRHENEVRQLNADLERRVAERTSQLEVINRELEAFSYSVSHDLRAPLRAIEGFAQALVDDYASGLDAPASDWLERIVVSARRMNHLIDDLLSLSQVTRSEMRRQSVDLTALAQVIAADLCRLQPERVVQFVIAPDLVVEGDSHLLRIALENLLGNAWRYTGRHARARIELGLIQIGDEPVFFVRDDGAGFDPKRAGKLFGAFQRLHSQEEFEGTGIGLATVQRIVHRHGGRIWAESTVEQGATFYFTLPSGRGTRTK